MYFFSSKSLHFIEGVPMSRTHQLTIQYDGGINSNRLLPISSFLFFPPFPFLKHLYQRTTYYGMYIVYTFMTNLFTNCILFYLTCRFLRSEKKGTGVKKSVKL